MEAEEEKRKKNDLNEEKEAINIDILNNLPRTFLHTYVYTVRLYSYHIRKKSSSVLYVTQIDIT